MDNKELLEMAADADAFRLMVRIKKLAADNPVEWDDQPEELKWAWVEFCDAFDSGDDERCREAVTTLAAAYQQPTDKGGEK